MLRTRRMHCPATAPASSTLKPRKLTALGFSSITEVTETSRGEVWEHLLLESAMVWIFVTEGSLTFVHVKTVRQVKLRKLRQATSNYRKKECF